MVSKPTCARNGHWPPHSTTQRRGQLLLRGPHQCPSGRRSRRRLDGKVQGGGGHGDEKQVSWKRTHHRDEEDEDSHKENRRKAKVAPGSTEKSEYRKSTHDWDTMKEGRRSSREKKHPGKHSTQEWDLWDETILGGCY